ncbi:hypothetical protein QEN19_000170 [Hanseniaspora menglaensis]
MSSYLFDSFLNTAIHDNGTSDIDLQKALDMSDMIRSQSITTQQAKTSLLQSIKQYSAFNSNNKNKVHKLWQIVHILMMNSGLTFIRQFFFNLEFLKVLQQHISTVEEKRLTGQLNDYKNLRDCLWKIYLDLKVYSSEKPMPPFTNINRILEPLEDKNCYPPQYLIDVQDSYESLCKKFDARTPGEWIESEFCLICNDKFGIFNRKHHCRNCGGVFCNEHSSHFIQLLDLGITEKVRVCDDCYKTYTDKRSGDGKRNKTKKHSKAVNVDEYSYDEDLKKAIELSLKESQEIKQKKHNPVITSFGEIEFHTDDEIELPEEYANEDEEFRKAIELSIKEDKRRERDAKRQATIKQQIEIERSISPNPELTQEAQENHQLDVNIADLVKKMQNKEINNPSSTLLVDDSIQKAQRLKELIEKETNELERKYQMLQTLNQQVNTNTINYNTSLETKIHEINKDVAQVKPSQTVAELSEEEEEENPYAKYYQQPVPKLAKATVPKYVSQEPAAPKKRIIDVEKRKSVLEQLNGLSFEESTAPFDESADGESESVPENIGNKIENDETHINNVNFPTVPFVKPPVKDEEAEHEFEKEGSPMLIEF